MSETTDILLRDIARKIQLSPTLHKQAEDHYNVVYRHLRRAESNLRDVVTRMYPQGSMMIGASVSSRVDSDEFDIDLILELALDPSVSPRLVLDALYREIRGDRGSRYHAVTERRSRCVQIAYANMHLDVTPAILLPGQPERTSRIFHSKQELPPATDYSITANPWGFGEWFKQRTPLPADLVEAARVRKMAEPVADQEPVEDKSDALVALQLVKRWRNLLYDGRPKGRRKPPSVLLAKLFADAAGRRMGLLAELMYQVSYVWHFFKQANDRGEKIVVVNPTCQGDVFSDRWPEDLQAQAGFMDDLARLYAELEKLKTASMAEKQTILTRLFGEATTQIVVEEFNKRAGAQARAGALRSHLAGGAVAVAASGLGGVRTATRPADSRATPVHRFFGDEEKPRQD